MDRIVTDEASSLAAGRSPSGAVRSIRDRMRRHLCREHRFNGTISGFPALLENMPA